MLTNKSTSPDSVLKIPTIIHGFLIPCPFMWNSVMLDSIHGFIIPCPFMWNSVMLDSRFNVKLGDFGLARLMDHELGPGPLTTGLAGILGYIAPEYVRTGKASKESDVYSCGVVAMEICCGRKARDCVDKILRWV
ncbi:hypothetical protein LXL04_013673 [Taraxacum kok-saghyz]